MPVDSGHTAKPQAVQPIRIVLYSFRQYLDRYLTFELRILSQVRPTHAAST